ncbi:MAG: S8 family serine peptidase, partial [Nitriliruptor sp.]
MNTAEDDEVVDPLRGAQWWWKNEGQQVQGSTGFAQVGLAGIDIGAEASWVATRGRPDVVVAVVDTGMDIHHPDLQANLWHNPTVGAFGCPDDLHGCDFSGPMPTGEVYSGVPGEDDHGTHIAGIVAAAEDGYGMVGVAPRVRLMSVKFLREDKGFVGDGIRAIQYATSAGADVINASWAVSGTPTSTGQLAQLDQAMRDARIPVAAAAGNEGADLADAPAMPASSEAPNVITVTAFDNRGIVPEFANWSAVDVDVAAPGVRILSTLPEGRHGYLDGTSQAAPTVSGLAALAVSATGNNDGARIARAIRVGARPFGPLNRPGPEYFHAPSSASVAGVASGPGMLHALGVRLGACPTGAPPAPASDLPRPGTHTANIDCVVHHGLAGGYSDGTYRPNDTVSRGQVATFLANLYRTAAPLAPASEPRFTDLGTSVHRDAIESLAAVGVVSGI